MNEIVTDTPTDATENTVVDISATQEPAAESANVSEAVVHTLPTALVSGQAVQLPEDLYIPPDALQVFLEAFEGPMDLLLYLIKRQNLDILDIPIAAITHQYIEYVEMMRGLRFELAAEYLVMAAYLAEIKSRMLLPREQDHEDDAEADPRAELVRRLQEYEQFKIAAENLDELPREGRDVFNAQTDLPDLKVERPLPQLQLRELLLAFKDVMSRAEFNRHHHIQFETLSVRERMSSILSKIKSDSFIEFTTLFNLAEGRIGVVVTFLAILELLKESMIEVIQNESNSPIHIKAAA